jgi:chaperonin GroEL
MLTGKVGVIYVGADSAVELKEKKDRVEDAIHATKAALQEGIIPGGGTALLNASQLIEPKNDGYSILLKAIQEPYNIILGNAGYSDYEFPKARSEASDAKEDWVGIGVDVTCGCYKRMIESGIIDPVLVTKSALKNAISVATTIISADCIISNVRSLESN